MFIITQDNREEGDEQGLIYDGIHAIWCSGSSLAAHWSRNV